MKSAADYILGSWNAPEIPLRIEYTLEIMEELRALLVEEVPQAAPSEAEVAGVLFGASRGTAIRILAWRRIARSVSDARSPHMSLHDRAEMIRALSSAASDPQTQNLEPLGWFVSHSEPSPGLASADIEIFQTFFPSPWQVTLLLRRAPGGIARAGFFAREPGGYLRSDASYRELLIQPVRRVPGAPGPTVPMPPIPPLQNPAEPVAKIETRVTPIGRMEAVFPQPAPAPLPSVPTPVITAPVEILPRLPLSSADRLGDAAPSSTPAAITACAQTQPAPEPLAPVAGQSEERKVTETIAPLAPTTAVAPASPAPAPSAHGSSTLTHAPELPTVPLAVAAEPPMIPASPASSTPALAVPREPSPPVPASALASAPRPSTERAAETASPLTEDIPATDAELPVFELQKGSFGGARWLWVLPVLLAVAVVTVLLMQKTPPAPPQTFSLRVAASDDLIEILWDRDSRPVLDGQRASIRIQDGPNTKNISLSAEQLRNGKTTYARETGEIAVQMTIYAADGREFHEFARLVAQTPPTAAVQPSPESDQLRQERDDLQSQVQQLKQQVRKEASRADQAQGVVRILENRIKVRPQDQKK